MTTGRKSGPRVPNRSLTSPLCMYQLRGPNDPGPGSFPVHVFKKYLSLGGFSEFPFRVWVDLYNENISCIRSRR